MPTKAEGDNTPREDALIRSIMRNMAWERAKGEMFSMLETYAGEHGLYQEMKTAISVAMNEIERQL